MVECKELCAFYGKSQVLDKISFTMERGEFVVLVGKNAAGKTTLLRALLGALKGTSGDVLLDGVSQKDLKRAQIAQRIAYLPQHTNASAFTVFDTVLMGRLPHLSYPRIYREQDRKIARECIEKLSLTPYMDTPLNNLSGGFRQRTALACALACESDYLFLDEPTTFLDIESSMELLRTLCNLAHDGKGVLAVLHDLPLALRFADRILILDGAHLVASDTPDVLFSSGVLEDVFGVRIERTEADGETIYYIS
ncbi:MAG: ABC transporter ATP-binding protein [Clostridia bacterium]|nr:ABC transporter ATP-binding protein [Clostridia bacterium]